MRQKIQEVQKTKKKRKEKRIKGIPRMMVKRDSRATAIHNLKRKPNRIGEYHKTPGDISSRRKMETRTADALMK